MTRFGWYVLGCQSTKYKLHDRNVDIVVSGKPTKGLLGYINEGKAVEYMNEIRVVKGVRAVAQVNCDANFFVQGDLQTDRLSLVIRTTTAGSFLAATGSRFPTE